MQVQKVRVLTSRVIRNHQAVDQVTTEVQRHPVLMQSQRRLIEAQVRGAELQVSQHRASRQVRISLLGLCSLQVAAITPLEVAPEDRPRPIHLEVAQGAHILAAAPLVQGVLHPEVVLEVVAVVVRGGAVVQEGRIVLRNRNII